jgi:hypothetical protein
MENKSIVLGNFSSTNTLFNNPETYIFNRSSLSNYIPHNPRRVKCREVWQQAYLEQLRYIYIIIKRIITMYFPKHKINWNKPQIQNNISKVIYHCSSKYISPYLDNVELIE